MKRAIIAAWVWDHTPRGMRDAIIAAEGWPAEIAGLSFGAMSREQRALLLERLRRSLETFAVQYGEGLEV